MLVFSPLHVAVCPLTVGKISIIRLHAVYHIHLQNLFSFSLGPTWKFQMGKLDAIEINNHSFHKDQNFTLWTANTLSRHKASVYFCIRIQDNIYKILKKKINHKYMCSSTLVCSSIIRPQRYFSAVQRRCNQTTQTVFSNTAGILRLRELNLQVPLDTQVLFFDGTQLSLNIFIIQVLSFGTGCKIFPEIQTNKKNQTMKTVTVLWVIFLALKEPLP